MRTAQFVDIGKSARCKRGRAVTDEHISTGVGLQNEPSAKANLGVRVIAAIVLSCAAGLIAWQVADNATPDGTTVSALLAGAAAVLALAYPRSFVSLGSRVSHVDAFGIKLDLQAKEAQLTIAQFAYEEDGADLDPPKWPSSNRKAMEMVAGELRAKLRFSSIAILGDRANISEEYVVDNLGQAGLLSVEEAALCKDLLGDLYQDLSKLDDGEREEFLDKAWAYVSRFASRTFDRQVRRALTNGGWKVADFTQDKGHRRDFIAVRDGIRALIAARVASSKEKVVSTGQRVAQVQFPLPDLRRLVVVPEHVDHLWREIDDRPMRVQELVLIMRINQLTENPELACVDPAGATLVPEARG